MTPTKFGRNSQISPEARRAGRIWVAIIVLILFIPVGVNLYVYWLVKQRPMPLVTETYYEEGLAYDALIEAGQDNKAFNRRMVLHPEGLVRVEAADAADAITGTELHFVRPDRADLDFRTPVTGTVPGLLYPVTTPPVTGRWQVTLRGWKNGDPVLLSTEGYVHRL